MPRKRNRLDTQTLHTASITGLSHEGRGISHFDDKTTFVFNALPTEEVEFHYTLKRRQIFEGSATRILKASPERIDAQCPHFSVCGGCSLQHMNSNYQRDIKLKSALELLKAQSITPTTLLPTLQSEPWGYRRKARISVKYIPQKDKVVVGFHERQSNLIADIDECHVLDPRIGMKIADIKKLIYTLDARDKIAQLEVAATDDEVALIIRHLVPLTPEDLAKINTFAEEHKFCIFLQSAGIDSIKEEKLLHYTLPQFNLRFAFKPFQFTQVNDSINQQMVAEAIKSLALKNTDSVLDLFCGLGNFTLAIAKHAAHATGVEADKTAISSAQDNARLNHIDNAEFHIANLFENCSDFSWARRRYDKILLDPPRAGAQEILALIPTWKPSHIVYISCNPTTFARDAGILKHQGYALTQFRTLDMFPHTQHTEVMGLFE